MTTLSTVDARAGFSKMIESASTTHEGFEVTAALLHSAERRQHGDVHAYRRMHPWIGESAPGPQR